MKFTIALIFSTSFLCVSGQSQTNSTISVVDTNLATKITVSGFCLCRTSLPDLEKLVPALKSVHVEEIDLPENCFGQDGRFENGKGYSSEKYPGITDDTTVLISFIAKFDERKATKDGYYLGGYVVNIDNAQAKLLKGKTIKITGKVSVEKGMDNNKNTDSPISQGRSRDTKHIESPLIQIVKSKT